MSKTEVNYFSTTAPEYYQRARGEILVGAQVDPEEAVDLESLARGLDRGAEQSGKQQKFELDSSSVDIFAPASYASFHPETNQCRNIVLEARYWMFFINEIIKKYHHYLHHCIL